MSAALGVAAFVVVMLELVAAVGVVLVARKFWRQVEPQVRPLLSMFAPAKAEQAIDPAELVEPPKAGRRDVWGDAR